MSYNNIMYVANLQLISMNNIVCEQNNMIRDTGINYLLVKLLCVSKCD